MATSTSWSVDSARIFFDGVAEEDYESVYGLSNLYSVDVASGAVTRLELPRGFWINPTASPEGGLLAFAGFEHGEKTQTYTARELWVSRSDGSGLKKISADLDRDAETLQWSPDASGVYFSSDDNGSRQVFFASLEGEVRQITHGNHAVYLGNFDRNGVAVASLSLPDQPPAIVSFSLSDFQGFERQTGPDPGKLAKAPIGEIEELRFESADGTALQGWLLKPPEFDASLKYPVILEIHGGPHEMYHWGWSTYFQGLAAQGFLVLYTNPRGSSGYGTPFGNAIDNDFPGEKDRADLMAAVEAVSAFPYADGSRLFVTGCSAGGTLTLWLVAHTQRFSAAAANCVISDFLAYAGTADVTDWSLHRFEERPWDNPSAWLEHSPLMMAGQIRTPTLLMGGEQDLRTPIAQAEQMFAALLVQGVPTRLVRFPTEAHGTTHAPSNLMRTILYISDWFRQWSRDGAGQASETNGRAEGSAGE
jgi:dipeptidyl aminopeptidase/acylaminoacyl peptidase